MSGSGAQGGVGGGGDVDGGGVMIGEVVVVGSINADVYLDIRRHTLPHPHSSSACWAAPPHRRKSRTLRSALPCALTPSSLPVCLSFLRAPLSLCVQSGCPSWARR